MASGFAKRERAVIGKKNFSIHTMIDHLTEKAIQNNMFHFISLLNHRVLYIEIYPKKIRLGANLILLVLKRKIVWNEKYV